MSPHCPQFLPDCVPPHADSKLHKQASGIPVVHHEYAGRLYLRLFAASVPPDALESSGAPCHSKWVSGWLTKRVMSG